MSICVTTYGYNGKTYITTVSPQPSDVSTCAYVLQTGAEAVSSPWRMTRAEGTQLGVAIALLWVTVGVAKMVSRRS